MTGVETDIVVGRLYGRLRPDVVVDRVSESVSPSSALHDELCDNKLVDLDYKVDNCDSTYVEIILIIKQVAIRL
jgi:hypothetical protein